MYEMFLEIAYEADVKDMSESTEMLELAAKLCKENIATRDAAINELRRMIYDLEECHPIRTDDEFLLRFLRSKNFIVRRAYKLLVRYCTFREEYKSLYEDYDIWSIVKTKNIFGGSFFDRPDVGRLIVFRICEWDPNELSLEDILRAAMSILEIGIRLPKLQIIGGTLLFDLQGMTMKQISAITPSVAYQIICIMGMAQPLRLISFHVINYSWFFNSVFYLFKKFIPEYAYKRIQFHGNDLKSLHKHVDPLCLPPKYGGTCRSYASAATWIQKIKKYRDERFDREMKQLGYVVKE